MTVNYADALGYVVTGPAPRCVAGAFGQAQKQGVRAERDTPELIEVLPEGVMPVTITRRVLNAAATRVFFRGHHDQACAKEQGVRDAYLNTVFFQGLVDRMGKAWAGPDAWLARRRLQMIAPVCASDVLKTEGRVLAIKRDATSQTAGVAVDSSTERGLASRRGSPDAMMPTREYRRNRDRKLRMLASAAGNGRREPRISGSAGT